MNKLGKLRELLYKRLGGRPTGYQIGPDNITVLVLAGHHDEFQRWMKVNRRIVHERSDTVRFAYFTNTDQLDAHFGARFFIPIFYGTFWSRKDAAQIESWIKIMFARQCQLQEGQWRWVRDQAFRELEKP